MTDNTDALPPLPKPHWPDGARGKYTEAFTADQMRDYARAALAQRQQVQEARLEAAFREGYFSRETYNDKDVTDVDEQWEKARAAITAAPSAQAEPQVPLPFNSAQRRRLWDNSPEIHADAKSFAAFERIVQLVEAARGIGKQEGK